MRFHGFKNRIQIFGYIINILDCRSFVKSFQKSYFTLDNLLLRRVSGVPPRGETAGGGGFRRLGAQGAESAGVLILHGGGCSPSSAKPPFRGRDFFGWGKGVFGVVPFSSAGRIA